MPAADLVALDNAMAGARLVEAGELLYRLERDADAGHSTELDLLRAEWLIAVGRAAEALPRLSVREVPGPLRCRIVSARTMALLATVALDDADRLVAAEEVSCRGEPVYWRGVGRLHLARARAGDAVAALRRAARLQPASNDVQGELAVALIEAGQAGEGAAILSALLQRDPTRADVRINLDFALGMLGQKPARAVGDDDLFWSRRLQFAGLGARDAGRSRLAEAMLGQAILARPRHDAELWQQYDQVSGDEERDLTLARH